MTKNVLTTEAVADWCETQPADLTYQYSNPQHCACGQYARHIGMEHDWHHTERQFWIDIDDLAFQRPRTFGAFAERLRAS